MVGSPAAAAAQTHTRVPRHQRATPWAFRLLPGTGSPAPSPTRLLGPTPRDRAEAIVGPNSATCSQAEGAQEGGRCLPPRQELAAGDGSWEAGGPGEVLRGSQVGSRGAREQSSSFHPKKSLAWPGWATDPSTPGSAFHPPAATGQEARAGPLQPQHPLSTPPPPPQRREHGSSVHARAHAHAHTCTCAHLQGRP